MPEPSSWVRTPTAVPFCSWTYRKNGFITTSRPRARTFVSALLIFLKAFSYSSSHTKPSHSPTLCGCIEGFGQEGVVRGPDLAGTCSSPKLPDLWVGLGACNGADSLFPLGAKLVLPLTQVKVKIFDSVLANLSLFPRNFVSCLP
jgi:hypothetical protein